MSYISIFFALMVPVMTIILWDVITDRFQKRDRELDWALLSNWVIAAAGLLTFAAASIQIFVFNRQLNAMSSTDQAVQRQLRLQEADLRPQLEFNKAKLVRKDDRDLNPKVRYELINVGKNAALIKELSARCRLVKKDAPYNLLASAKFSRAVVGANATITSGGNFPDCVLDAPLSTEDWSEITSGASQIWLYGVVKYEGSARVTYSQTFGVSYDGLDNEQGVFREIPGDLLFLEHQKPTK